VEVGDTHPQPAAAEAGGWRFALGGARGARSGAAALLGGFAGAVGGQAAQASGGLLGGDSAGGQVVKDASWEVSCAA
jgi:hypothetical protein